MLGLGNSSSLGLKKVSESEQKAAKRNEDKLSGIKLYAASFQDYMQGVRPLAQQNLADLKPRLRVEPQVAQARREAAVQTEVTTLGVSDGQVQAVEPGANLAFFLPDLPRRTRQSLSKGLIEWQQGLDLHGSSIEEARIALSGLLQDARAANQRCVLVVHGKSYNHSGELPSIKSHVNAWLRQVPEVLGFCSALPKDGGSGAVYILLRTKRSNNPERD